VYGSYDCVVYCILTHDVQMVTWHAKERVVDGEITSDERETALQVLPLRCIVDQRATKFISAFFSSDKNAKQPVLPPGYHAIPPPKFRHFQVSPFKMKVDYIPQELDSKALRDGAIVELINLSPLDALVLTLKEVTMEDKVGFGEVISFLVRSWLQDICSTQLLKFLTSVRPLEPITHVGGSATDLIVLPWEAFKNGDSMQKALRSGTSSLARAVTYETLTTTSRVTEYVAGEVARLSSSSDTTLLPSRPLETPRSLSDTRRHVVESLARGLQHANYKIVIVPYREYCRSGATGAVKSVVQGIPVAIAAPASGAVEALSFALLGARNQLRPDIRKEEEAIQRGLFHE
jgi:Autophagy-related protein C terminal domain